MRYLEPMGDERMEGERLAVRPREAARMLGVCTRTLHTWAARGVIRPMKIGGTVLYPVETLRAFLRNQAADDNPADDGGDAQ